MGRMFRLLKPNEIEVRTQSIKANGAILLLYKDARCDMNILDDTVGPFNWKREHRRDNANCIVSIYDKNKGEWISKEDTGSESNTEKEKGLASDSFKRACFNWGIGRELYTAPFIWVSGNRDDLKYARYECTKIGYDENGSINQLEITRTDNERKVVYSYGVNRKNNQTNNETTKPKETKEKTMSDGTHKAIARLSKDNENNKKMVIEELKKLNKHYKDLTQAEASMILMKLEKEETK